jgi:phosphocarrier protein FPr
MIQTPLRLFAPLSGTIVPLVTVPDPVFSQKMMGEGIAIDPTTNVLLSPCAGKIIQLHPAHHAVSIETSNGAQILLHIGLDTVKLKGEGFEPKVKLGDEVKTGQPLIVFDADLVAQKARSLITVMVVIEAPSHEMLSGPKTKAIAGQDVLLELNFQKAPASAKAAAGKPEPSAESKVIEVTLPTGVHARPAAQIVAKAKQYQAHIEVKKGHKSANAKSVVSLLGLEIGPGDSVKFQASGPDAKAAVMEMAQFLKLLKETPPEVKAPSPNPTGTSNDPNVLSGVSASPGIAIGRVHRLKAETFEITERSTHSAGEETNQLMSAIQKGMGELHDLRERLKEKTDASKAAIFSAHIELLEDPALIEEAEQAMGEGKTAAFAWNKAIANHANRLANLNNELMANRANDLRDVGNRVLRLLIGSGEVELKPLEVDSILIAESLTPSDTVQLDREKVLGFCTTTGGATSHVAILARSLGIPAVAGIDAKALDIPDGTEIVLDGDLGEIRLNPNWIEKEKILDHQREVQNRRKTAMTQTKEAATTLDGKTIEVAANIGGLEDAKKAVELGCDGVGLLRSEFLFLERATAPSEEEQFRAYQEIANVLGKRPLIIRTLDVGGDKPLQYLPIPAEENPFLGVRGIRVGFLKPEILREQMRAILRVKSKGKILVMFPMIANLQELQQAKTMLEEERKKLGVAPIQVGIMIEVPSAALMADVLAPECDFFSIGTNDLTQYTLAMDRGHKDLAKQVDALDPSVLKLIDLTVKAAHAHGKWVGVCGGLASDAKAVPILLGLGIDELSVSIPVIPLVKSQVRETKLEIAKNLAQHALKASSAKEVRGS